MASPEADPQSTSADREDESGTSSGGIGRAAMEANTVDQQAVLKDQIEESDRDPTSGS
jgi:hypothetical protein